MLTDPRGHHTTAIRVVALAIDVLLLAAASIVVFVALTGGVVFSIGGTPISVRSTGNAVTAGAGLLFLRYFYLQHVPAFGFGRRTPADLDGVAASLLTRIASRDDGVNARIRVMLSVTLVVSAVLRLINAWAHPGFATGDDVEIHEMTFGRLFGESWTVWNLRSPLYPLGIVYPFQALASSAVGHDVPRLVFAGRLPVVAFATVAVWLVYRVTLRMTGGSGTALLAAVLLAASRLHLWFGSSELPRPVASAFILAGFWALISGVGVGRVALAGALLGIGGALRFGEFVFLAPALLHLALEHRWRHALVVGVAAATAAGICLGVADWVYWGQPFFSLINAVGYTLVRGASSRGFQPAWYYVTNATDWTNFVFLALGGAAILMVDRRIAIWIWTPLLLLSLFPHKEARYAIAVLPFLCMGVAVTLATPSLLSGSRRKTFAVLAVFLAALFELTSWRVRRTDDAVALARQVNSLRPSGVAAQDLWPFGGHLYFNNVNGPVVSFSEPVDPAQFLENGVQVVIVLRRSAGPAVRDDLIRRGFKASETLSTSQYATFVRD